MEIKTPNQWIMFGEVGTSSRTIWGVLTGAITSYVDSFNVGVPRDMDDFSRCYKLISLFPEWEARLSEVAAIFPQWIPFIREWDALKEAYRKWLVEDECFLQDRNVHPRKAEKAHIAAWREARELVHRLEDEGRLLDGWVQTGPGSWEKRKTEQTRQEG